MPYRVWRAMMMVMAMFWNFHNNRHFLHDSLTYFETSPQTKEAMVL